VKFVRIVVIILVSLAAVLILYSCLQGRLPSTRNAELPVDLQTIIPSTWTVMPDKYKLCDFDADGENEYLIIYSYDPAAVPAALPATPVPPAVPVVGRSLIGGVIYDTQVNRVPQAPGVQSPYRPAFLIPYKLLPDMYGGKGQGYLGQNSVTVNLAPAPANNAPCQAKEIMVFGTSYDAPPTNLSIFRWAGDSIGYIAAYFQGDTRLQAYGPNGSTQPTAYVVDVYTYSTLNQRSLLCSVQHYRRGYDPQNPNVMPPGLEFFEVKEDYTIDFCYGPPKDPAYPDGVVMALLRGQNPDAPSPSGASYFMPDAIVPPELQPLRSSPRPPIRTLSISAPGSLGLYPPQGTHSIWTPNSSTPSATPQVWWTSSNTAPVDTEIVVNGQVRQARWTLVSIANEQATSDTHWRISQVELR
jgi:hypothetical protein